MEHKIKRIPGTMTKTKTGRKMPTLHVLDLKKLKLFIKERKPIEVSAGILNDWSCTGATVYQNGKWVKDNQAYTSSTWATPGFKATMKNGDVIEVVAYIAK
jgi:hypothetical protein